ncbi:MAG: FMN-binding protein [Desulfobacteraceae bacterium]|nr:FMN-binding protein [Desulfobacteraceae bacterium]
MNQTLNSHRRSEGFRHNKLVQAWLVLLLAIIFGSALAAVQVNLSDVIAANKLNESLEQVPELVWGAAKAAELVENKVRIDIEPGILTVDTDGKKTVYHLFRVSMDRTLAGWVIRAGGQGYADKIELLIGLSPDAGKISGLFVLEQKETPGLGNKIIFSQWRDQYIGKDTQTPLTVTTGRSNAPDTIDAVTGATISSKSVTDIVNLTTRAVNGRLASVEYVKQ